ncbi:DNA-damage-repair/toleration protein [Morus notabilis]|uniref:DNA-damage-repair/toleration protein n=1 Tax=Morus notabilis TaxID=981085 RepID=W9S5T9_9ROSA|nr:DNA-damage-repair/toleration protein [Morus notabilis]
MAKSSGIVLFLLVLLFIGGLQLCFCKNSTFGCIKREREALLQLKQSFNYPSNRLVSWTGNDCFLWNGVSCNQITGRVVKLDLRAPADSPINEYEWGENFFLIGSWTRYDCCLWNGVSCNQITGRVVKLADSPSNEYEWGEYFPYIDSCLVELKRLEYLDLSGNYFCQSPIPEFFGSLKYLKYLNLSRTGFGGRIPAQLGNLTSLQILDLSQYYSGVLFADNFQWVRGLSSLKHLEMSFVSLNKALDVMQVLNTLPALLELILLIPPSLQRIQILDLEFNMLSGPILKDAINNIA